MQLDSALAAILDGIAALPRNDGRRLIAIAGPPGAGKSTLAEAVVSAIGDSGILVPMDGFHLDNRLLDARGLRPRKGAPETFDADGFVTAIGRLRQGGEVILPVFDRGRDLAIAGAVAVDSAHRTAVVEGNYLLFDAAPWTDLPPLWDYSVWLDVPDAELARRLTDRWLAHGLDPDAARARAEGNDLANARRIAAARRPADLVLPWEPPDDA